jgi:hypothetical protein
MYYGIFRALGHQAVASELFVVKLPSPWTVSVALPAWLRTVSLQRDKVCVLG